jgi:hypothetical protein
MRSKFRRPGASFQGSSAYMEIAYIRSTVQKIIPMVWMREALIWKIVCREGATVRMTGQHRPDAAQIKKEFQRNFGKLIAQLSVQTCYVYHLDGAKVFQARRSFEPAAYK